MRQSDNFRPTVHVKVMLKIVETTMIDKEMNGLRACFEPQRLGVATPDGHFCGDQSCEGGVWQLGKVAEHGADGPQARTDGSTG